MTDTFSLARANRAAAGIVPTVVPPHHHATLRLYAKASADVLATLGRVRDRRHRAMLDAMGVRGGTPTRPSLRPGDGFVDPFVRGAARPTTIPHPPLGDPATLTLDHQMTATILAQFVVENAAGRTAMARSLVAFVKKSGARHGMDALLLTALFHFEHGNDPALADALDTWRATMPTAGSVEGGDSGVVFDPARGGLVSIATAGFHDPFGGGVCLPQSVQHMQQLRGRDVGIGAFAVIIIQGVIGAIKGGIDAGSKDGASVWDVVWGAIAGAGNAIASALGVDHYIGFATQDTGKPTSQDTNSGLINVHTTGDSPTVVIGNPAGSQGTPDTKPTQGDVENPTGAPAGPSDPEGDAFKNSLGKGDAPAPTSTKDSSSNDTPPAKDPGGEDDHVPPPSNVGFPAPDDDGGSPWSLVGSAPLVPLSAARAMIAANAGPVFAVAQLPGLAALQSTMATHSAVLTQANALHTISDPARLAQLRTASATIASQVAANIHLAPNIGARIGAVGAPGIAGR